MPAALSRESLPPNPTPDDILANPTLRDGVACPRAVQEIGFTSQENLLISPHEHSRSISRIADRKARCNVGKADGCHSPVQPGEYSSSRKRLA